MSDDLRRLRAAFKEGCYRYAMPDEIPPDENIDRGVAALLREMQEHNEPLLQIGMKYIHDTSTTNLWAAQDAMIDAILEQADSAGREGE